MASSSHEGQECLDESHSQGVSSFEDSEETRRGLKAISDNNHEILQELDTQLNTVTKAQDQQNSVLEGTRQRIQERRSALHDIVDTVADEILSEFEDRQKANLDYLQTQQEMITKKMSEVNDIESKVKEVLKIESVTELIQASRTITAPSVDQDFEVPSTVQLQDGYVNSKQVQKMYGTVVDVPYDDQNEESPDETNIELSVQTEFEVYSRKNIQSMLTFNKGLCFMTKKESDELQLADENSYLHQRISLNAKELGGFDMCKNKHMYICCIDPNCIKFVKQPEGLVSTIFSTENSQPTDVCCIASDDLLVTLFEHDWRKSKHTTALVKFNKIGEELMKVEQDEFEDDLFHAPTRLRISKAEDTIAVIDQVDEDRSFLILLGDDFKVKTRYLGNGKVFKGNTKFTLPEVDEENRVMFTDIVFDSTGNMIISEVFSTSVLLLNPSCVVLQTLHKDREMPHALAIEYDYKLWVGIGYYEGNVKILKDCQKNKGNASCISN